jgi:hypothetical protein
LQRSAAPVQNPGDIPLPVKNTENLKRNASRLVDNEVGENSVEQRIARGEVSAAVADAWDLGQLVKTFEELGHDAVRRIDAILFQDKARSRRCRK